MASVTQIVGARTSLTVSGLSTLTANNYATSDAFNCTTDDPLDVIVEVAVTPGSVSGNRQAVVFALASLDGTLYQTGNTSADEAVMNYVGALPLPSNTTLQRKMFSVAAAFGGVLPAYFKIVVKNDCGSTFTTGTVFTSTVIGNVA